MSPASGALTPLYMAAGRATPPPAGFFYPVAQGGSAPPSELAADPALAKRLWTVSEKLVAQVLGADFPLSASSLLPLCFLSASAFEQTSFAQRTPVSVRTRRC